MSVTGVSIDNSWQMLNRFLKSDEGRNALKSYFHFDDNSTSNIVEMNQYDVITDNMSESTSQLSPIHFFFSINKNEEYIRNYPFLFFVDSTFNIIADPKDSKFFMITGVTCENCLFNACAAVMRSDRVSMTDFSWIFKLFLMLLKEVLQIQKRAYLFAGIM
jgi:hypothetical protein